LLESHLHPSFPAGVRGNKLINYFFELAKKSATIKRKSTDTYTPNLIAIMQVASINTSVTTQERLFFHDAQKQIEADNLSVTWRK
jgi:hypothetical protein